MQERPYLTTAQPAVTFENTAVGRLKKEIWEASDEEIDAILTEYGVPSPCEWAKHGSYIQTTVRHELVENRRRNDIIFIPVGSTELHGEHMVSAVDTLFVSLICEAVRRYTAKRGAPVNLALPPLMYGAHPYHHIGMGGNVIIRDEIAKEFLVDVMLGLWNDGFRKQIMVNNHGQLWVLEETIHQFTKRYQLPGIYRVIDWHRAVREFFFTKEYGGRFETDFVHAAEAETSIALLLFPEMVEMEHAVDTEPISFLPGGHLDTSVDAHRRPCRWSEGEGHAAIELQGTPEGVVGKSTLAEAQKAKRPLAAILRYLTLLHDEILEAFPPGEVPPTEEVSLRSAEEMEPYLKEPMSPRWKSVYGLPKVGQ
ncbi:MAG: 3-dehydro-scyllo-inosose hydrolase [Chloroflexota bacterium]|nr:3-dehydro-scyllo-inosose hydrolase [Chloroflexota bacterium]